jgi:structural maintenance of chromosome 3 (chondroitin sulfate proteoglycan 6)
MHIKQITISNFRSFKQQAEIQPFSPATNTVVGRNGSGKSNLFDAVQFCLLAPKFAHLRQVRRKNRFVLMLILALSFLHRTLTKSTKFHW